MEKHELYYSLRQSSYHHRGASATTPTKRLVWRHLCSCRTTRPTLRSHLWRFSTLRLRLGSPVRTSEVSQRAAPLACALPALFGPLSKSPTS
jgi:hypothetical protein